MLLLRSYQNKRKIRMKRITMKEASLKGIIFWELRRRRNQNILEGPAARRILEVLQSVILITLRILSIFKRKSFKFKLLSFVQVNRKKNHHYLISKNYWNISHISFKSLNPHHSSKELFPLNPKLQPSSSYSFKNKL